MFMSAANSPTETLYPMLLAVLVPQPRLTRHHRYRVALDVNLFKCQHDSGCPILSASVADRVGDHKCSCRLQIAQRKRSIRCYLLYSPFSRVWRDTIGIAWPWV